MLHVSHDTARIFLIFIVEEKKRESGAACLFYCVNFVHFGVIIEPRGREKERDKIVKRKKD